MKLKFYGTRGSIPVCDAGFQGFGGNTTCFQITFPDINQIAVVDAGTGIRNLGRDLRAMGHEQEQIVLAFTHFHWDHIQGFPFFGPAYDPKQKLTVLTLGEEQNVSSLREVFETQMQSVYFPVQLSHMGADFRFVQLKKATEHFGGMNLAATTITSQKLNHPGGAYAFRIERQGKVLVICTDVEHGD
jgi:phosphoribosyl 1,2-cyclic phosphodiesterase